MSGLANSVTIPRKQGGASNLLGLDISEGTKRKKPWQGRTALACHLDYSHSREPRLEGCTLREIRKLKKIFYETVVDGALLEGESKLLLVYMVNQKGVPHPLNT